VKHARVLVPLLAIATLAFFVRGGAQPQDDARAGAWDSASAYRLRLVELTLASGRAPRTDRFLEPPGGAVVPWPPLYHAAVAHLAKWCLARPGGDPALNGVDERELERLVVRLPSAIAVAGVLVLFAVGRRLCGGDARCGLVTAALFAVLPAAVELGSPARFAPDGAVIVLVAGVVACVQGALAGRDRVDGLSFAMAGGLLAGLAALSSLESLCITLPAVLAFVLAGRAEGAAAADARRAGVFFCVVAAVVCSFARVGSASDVPTSPEAGLSALFLVAGVPLLVLGVFSAERLGPFLRGAAALCAGGVIAIVLGLPGWILAELARSGGSLRSLAPGLPMGGWSEAAAWAALPVVAAVAWRELAPRLRVFLAVAAVCALVVSYAQGTSGATLLVVWSLFGAAAIVRGGRRAGGAAAVVCVFVCALGWWSARASPSGDDDAVWTGLRWLREGSSRAAPWNSAVATPAWSVLGPPEWDGWIAFHGRRPATCAALAGPVPESEPPYAALFAREAHALVRAMRGARVGFVVVAPGVRTPELLERYGPRTNLERLVFDDVFDGLERAWTSPEERVGFDGRAGPALSIWRVRADEVR